MIIIALFLGWLGVCFGSFVNALTWRLHTKKDWIKARSQCPYCGHTLAAKDLVPVLSWLMLRGRCRYCKHSISLQYPLVELAGGLVFAISYLFWPANLASGQTVLLVTWLAASVGLLALLVYDFRWMLLPSKIIYPTFALAATGRLVYLIGFEQNKPHALLWWLLSLAVASGLFWLLFMVSSGRWIGYGDVRLGLITGTILANPAKSFLMIFSASILGIIFVLPALASGRKNLAAKIPYGPFLIVACGITLLFGSSFLDWYSGLLT